VLYPLTFQPIFKERVWGGRNLARLSGKTLPPGANVGESWEISDRPGDTSVIANGPLAGKNLHWLMTHHASELLGSVKPQNGRFPLLVKILDAQETLSVQVHPPAHKAPELGGEPKTEMWYIADAAPNAELFAGLKRGITRGDFERKIRTGSVADCLHRVKVRTGDAMFLPSGRVHAIGAGLVIFEIQQNSDTTYRVFDWNRTGLDAKPRELHLAESLASIDFNDFEPMPVEGAFSGDDPVKVRPLVRSPLFAVESVQMAAGAVTSLKPRTMQIIACVGGKFEVKGGAMTIARSAGEFCLVPASLDATTLQARTAVTLLRVEAG
jgi:mannose-6-phosphate isomerase